MFETEQWGDFSKIPNLTVTGGDEGSYVPPPNLKKIASSQTLESMFFSESSSYWDIKSSPYTHFFVGCCETYTEKNSLDTFG